MRAVQVPTGSVVVDSLPYTVGGTLQHAKDLAARKVKCMVCYLGGVTRERIDNLHLVGIGFMPVTYASHYDGPQAVAQLQKLGMPPGVTCWLDVEGKAAFNTPIPELATLVNAWARAVSDAGFQPGLYIGSPQPFTSEELYKLAVVRYWRGQGETRDRHGAFAEPHPRGFCMTQMFPSVNWDGLMVDANMVGEDYRHGLPSMAVP